MSLSFNRRLAAIGMRVGAPVSLADSFKADIERTLLETLGMMRAKRDGRLAGLLFTWVKVHGHFVICEKLEKFARREEAARPGSTAWLSALAGMALQEGIHKWRKLARKSRTPQYLYPADVTRAAVSRKGAIGWLKRLGYLVAQGSLRIREKDVLAPTELIRVNRQYQSRFIYGASWRADIITAIEEGARSPSEVARLTGCSYEPAHRIFRQFTLARGIPARASG
jgi:hypothetical protein